MSVAWGYFLRLTVMVAVLDLAPISNVAPCEGSAGIAFVESLFSSRLTEAKSSGRAAASRRREFSWSRVVEASAQVLGRCQQHLGVVAIVDRERR